MTSQRLDRMHKFKSDKSPGRDGGGLLGERKLVSFSGVTPGQASCSGVALQHKLDSSLFCVCLFFFFKERKNTHLGG